MSKEEEIELDDRLYINPRINSTVKKDFERGIFELKQEGYKFQISELIRSFIDEFNADPEKMVKQLGIEKK